MRPTCHVNVTKVAETDSASFNCHDGETETGFCFSVTFSSLQFTTTLHVTSYTNTHLTIPIPRQNPIHIPVVYSLPIYQTIVIIQNNQQLPLAMAPSLLTHHHHHHQKHSTPRSSHDDQVPHEAPRGVMGTGQVADGSNYPFPASLQGELFGWAGTTSTAPPKTHPFQ